MKYAVVLGYFALAGFSVWVAFQLVMAGHPWFALLAFMLACGAGFNFDGDKANRSDRG